MKTTFILTTLLVVAIQAMVNGQTQDNQVSNGLSPSIKKGNSAYKNNEQKKAGIANNSEQENLAKKIAELTEQINALQAIKQSVANEINNFFDKAESTSTQVVVNQQIQLKQTADQLLANVDILYSQLASPTCTNKEALKEEIDLKENQAYAILLQLSETTALENSNQFQSNRGVINELMYAPTSSEEDYLTAYKLQREADRYMRIAGELRTEAKVLENLKARYGAIGNAEEHEFTALQTQQQTIDIFKTHVCMKK